LRWFRQNADVTALLHDAGISRATGYRYRDEVITGLAEQAPDLHEALNRAKQAVWPSSSLTASCSPPDRGSGALSVVVVLSEEDAVAESAMPAPYRRGCMP
jgi:hypothetical protein